MDGDASRKRAAGDAEEEAARPPKKQVLEGVHQTAVATDEAAAAPTDDAGAASAVSPTLTDGIDTKNLSKADKRAHHNALERKRRDHIKDSFTVLRDSIPALAGEKSSRAQILNKATDFIVHMRKKNGGHQGEMERLRRENDELERQASKLEELKKIAPP
eukprot:CAMPEP_0182927958 /NCGR_PEP_ID=MMETSP0105_2-20130417/14818_1 /TAXON_ID=81532 ORGANISM="Acanthoeca-like sp., Strain 10tr" /NCGR_SAMPLE_ID=MMETSP0105_2 /ASSEMBLY_ACC=CAM_ASM_000205 /LENGTH=159 /DNA_ID=CAMNT_0025065941 /DNA_START=42 /DNA_END=521 /DNA_ORIENTATION=+